MSVRTSANDKAIGGAVHVIGLIIIIVASVYADVMFLGLMWDAYPPGFLRVLAILGAFTTSLSVIALTIGKTKWFRPGGQVVFAWLFTLVEVAVCVMNAVAGTIVALHQPLNALAYWVMVAPATPFLSMLGWILLIYLDPARGALHLRMEMEDEKLKAELDYERAVHEANMGVKHQYLMHTKQFLTAELQSPQRQAEMQRAASSLLAGTLTDVTGKPHYEMNGLPASGQTSAPVRTVDADTPPKK